MAGAAVTLALGAATQPAALSKTMAGLWELSGAPGAKTPVRECFADVAALAQFEHRRNSCTRTVISDKVNSAVIEYSCAGAGFGRSEVDVITPRSLRIDTQGISDNLPFHYVLQARRAGDCPGGQSAARH
jgi:hypothetical protein